MFLFGRNCRLKRIALISFMTMLLAAFLCLPATANSILTSPAGGESWTQASSHNITWNSITPVFPTWINLEYSSDSGNTWTAVASNLDPSSGQYAWSVPDSLTSKARIKLEVFVKNPITLITNKTAEEQSGDFTIKSKYSVLLPADPPFNINLTPDAPSNLDATAGSSSKIALSWEDKSVNESGFKIERKSGGAFTQIATVGADVEAFQDLNLDSGTSYTYRVRSYNGFGDSDYSNQDTAITWNLLTPHIPPVLPGLTTEMRFYIDSSDYYVGDEIKSMDTVPQIMEGRTILPIRYVVQPLGADVDWNDIEQKVTITMGGKEIVLWIGNSIASVDGAAKAIDPDNGNVKPIIVPPGRTMLPLRFIAEELGCQVDWNPDTKEIKITYPDPS